MHSRFTGLVIGLFVLDLVVGAGALADDIQVDNFWYRNVRVRGVREGRLLYLVGGSSRDVALDRVKAIQLSRYPDYQRAVEALDEARAPRAVVLLSNVLSRVREDDLKPLIRARLVQAYDQSGRFTEALSTYLELLQADDSAYFAGLAPDNLPDEQAQREAAAADVARAIRSVRSEAARRALADLRRQLESAAPAQPQPDQTPDADTSGNGDAPADTPGPDTSPRQPADAQPTPALPEISSRSVQLIFDRIEQGNYDEALKRIEAMGRRANAPLETLLYARGLAKAGRGDRVAGALDMLRVAIVYSDHELADRCLLEAGRLLNQAGRTDAAKKVLTEAADRADDPAIRQAAEQLLGSP
jgi:tetratricopeptide (TPR) repeat protein